MDAKMFGARLKELREQKGLTQKELADRAGVSQRGVSHWEQGLREPAWSNVIALANALGVDCRAFTEEPTSTPDLKRGRPAKKSEEPEPPKRPAPRPRKGG